MSKGFSQKTSYSFFVGALRAPLPNLFLQRRAPRGAVGMYLEKVRVRQESSSFWRSA
jgi:hypothetical protein